MKTTRKWMLAVLALPIVMAVVASIGVSRSRPVSVELIGITNAENHTVAALRLTNHTPGNFSFSGHGLGTKYYMVHSVNGGFITNMPCSWFGPTYLSHIPGKGSMEFSAYWLSRNAPERIEIEIREERVTGGLMSYLPSGLQEFLQRPPVPIVVSVDVP